MTTSLKIVSGAAVLLAAAVIGGALMSTAFAGDSDTGTDDLTDGGTAYCQTFIDTFASELGVETDALAPAAKAAASASVNAAIEAGDITQDQADAMIERINNWDGTGCGWIGFHLGGGHHGEGPGFMSSVFTTVADALGMEPADLREALADASLEEVAADQNVSYDDVTRAALAAAKTDLDAAVADGTITQDRADAVYDHLSTWLADGGAFERHGWGGGRHHQGLGLGG